MMTETGNCLVCSYLRVSTHVMELPGAELEGFQQALDILLKKTMHHIVISLTPTHFT